MLREDTAVYSKLDLSGEEDNRAIIEPEFLVLVGVDTLVFVVACTRSFSGLRIRRWRRCGHVTGYTDVKSTTQARHWKQHTSKESQKPTEYDERWWLRAPSGPSLSWHGGVENFTGISRERGLLTSSAATISL